MFSLDKKDEIGKLDKSNLINSIYNLSDQILQAWNEVNDLDVKFSEDIKNIVVAGMGGSALGGRIVGALLKDKLRIPLYIVTDYKLPGYVDKNTLVILSSYSGNTQETFDCFREANDRNAQVFGITTGGKLKELFESHKLPCYVFNPFNNPSGQPRMSLGYSTVSILALLAKIGFVNIRTDEIISVAEEVFKFTKELSVDIPENDNLAKRMARKLKGKEVYLIAGEHLLGVTHAFKNQLNENAKTMSFLFDLPELNHHLLEGLRNPAQVKEWSAFLFFESKLYTSQTMKIVPVVKDVVTKNDLEVLSYPTRHTTKLSQVFEILVFGSFVSYYLALLYDIDPTPIPWVAYLKEKLS